MSSSLDLGTHAITCGNKTCSPQAHKEISAQNDLVGNIRNIFSKNQKSCSSSTSNHDDPVLPESACDYSRSTEIHCHHQHGLGPTIQRARSLREMKTTQSQSQLVHHPGIGSLRAPAASRIACAEQHPRDPGRNRIQSFRKRSDVRHHAARDIAAQPVGTQDCGTRRCHGSTGPALPHPSSAQTG